MANIIGNDPEFWAKNQVNLRQQLLGVAERTPEILAWQNTKTAWIRAASAVYIEEGVVVKSKNAAGEEVERTIDKSTELTETSLYRGRALAKEYILFNGTVGFDSQVVELDDIEKELLGETDPFLSYNNQKFTQKSGVSSNNTNINQNVYGFGGTEKGLEPMPGIIDLSVNTLSRGSLRKAELKFKAYNKKQFQILDALYMRPGYTILIEWGHTHYFTGKPENYQYTKAQFNTLPFETLMNAGHPSDGYPTQDDLLKQIRIQREDSNGNYDGFYGKVTNFNWALNEDGTYNITVYAVSIGDVIESLTINHISPDYKEEEPKEGSSNNSDDSDKWYYFSLTDDRGAYERKVKKGTESRYREYWRDERGFKDADKDGLFDDVRVDGTFSEIDFKMKKKFHPSTMNSYTLTRPPDRIAKEPTLDNALISQREKSVFNKWLYSMNTTISNNLKNSTTEKYSTNNKGLNSIKVKYFRDTTSLGIRSRIELPVLDGASGDETGRTKTKFSKNNPYQYLKLWTILHYIEKELLIYSEGGDPYLKFDITPDKEGPQGNYCYTQPDQFSSDPGICLIPFKSRSSANPEDLTYSVFEDIAGLDFRNEKSPYVGNLMHMWVNVNYVATVLDKSESGGSIPLLRFLENFMRGIQDALGNVNKFSVTYDHDENQIIIRDDVPLDPSVTDTHKKPDERVLLNVYGWKPKVQNGSFVQNLGIQATLSNKFATMISIGAQSRSTSDITNATAFSRWNEGLIDVITPKKLSKVVAKQTKEEQGKPLDKFKDNLKDLYKKGNVIHKFYQNVKSPPTETIESTRNVNSKYQQFLTTYYNKEFNVPSTQGFIPFNMSLTMDGFSGFRIYERFFIEGDVLPPSYPDNLQFILKGLKHTINQSGWNTIIESMAMQAVVEEALKAPANVITTPPEPEPDPDSLVPNADKLREVLTTLGYKEKGEEISNGGDISDKMYRYASSVFRKINELYPDIVITVTGGNDAYHQNLSYTSSHSLGDGLDFVISPLTTENKNNIDSLLGSFVGGNQGQKVSFINEYDYPSSAATAGHFHIRIGGRLEGGSRTKNYITLANSGGIETYPIA